MSELDSPLYPEKDWSAIDTLLLLCARVTWDDDTRLRAETALQRAVEWDRFLRLAVIHGLGPLTHHHLCGLSAGIPDQVRAHLQGMYDQSMIANTLRYHALGQILDVFERAAIPVVLWKGAALARTVYPNVALRPMRDLDLIIPPSSANQAIALLGALGYELDSQVGALNDHHMPEVKLVKRVAGMPVVVDLHWRAFVGLWVEQVMVGGEQAFWDTAREYSIEGQSALLAAPVMGLLGVILHTLIHHNLGMDILRTLTDVDAWLQTYVIPSGWADLTKQARALRVATPVYMALSLCQVLLDTHIPHTVMADLTPSSLHRDVLRRMVPLESCLNGDLKLSGHHRRFIWQFFLLDRPLDLAKLARSALFPSRQWIEARYALDGSWHSYLRYSLLHLFNVVLKAQISLDSDQTAPTDEQ